MSSAAIYVVKYDKNGKVIWAKAADETANISVYGNSIAVDKKENVYVTGGFGKPIHFDGIPLTGSGMMTIKYNLNGKALWAKSAGTCCDSKGWGNNGSSIGVDDYGNSYVTGNYKYELTVDGIKLTNADTYLGETMDIFLVKYDSLGKVSWAKRAGGRTDDYSKSISTDAKGNSYITGFFSSTTLTFEYLLKDRLFLG